MLGKVKLGRTRGTMLPKAQVSIFAMVQVDVFSFVIPGLLSVLLVAFVFLTIISLKMSATKEGLLHRQKPNSYIFLVLFLLGLGSVSYGYNASIIGTTLGMV